MKSIAPFLTCTSTFGRNWPSSLRELHVGPLGAIGIDVLVVDERAPDDVAAVRRERVGEHVGAFGVAAAVVLRAGLPFGVRLDGEAAEVGHQRVDLLDLALPPAATPGSSGSAVFKPPSLQRRGDVRREIQPDAVGPEDVRQRRDLGEIVGRSGCATSALTLLTTAPLMPIEALARA